jgi:hypothetical protein
MSSTERQNRLLLAEDWKTVYQSFKYADFQSYDFDNLRRTMINYIRQNYPEDFNDYIESSEYLALIDLIAFLGQNIAFRADLNARENYIETAERRESVLRLARLVSYNVKRNQTANGLLKFDSISTTEDVIDSNGTNLSGQTVIWNDSTNADWYEQFVKILNSALPADNKFGKSIKKETIDSVLTEQYRLNSISNSGLPIYSFTKNVDSITTQFEIVSTDIDAEKIYEEEPLAGNRLAFLYRDDGQGAGSNNSGFFLHFRQGRLENNVVTVDNPTPNTTINIDTDNINNSDVWLYQLDSNNLENKLWTKVDNIEGNNIIYNSINKKVRDIYGVLSRVQDRISLIFSDGTFGTLPKGKFKVYYRTSNARQFKIVPSDMTGITITVPYTSKAGKVETLSLTMELKTVIDNSAAAESNSSIKTNAPSTYYTQNRLITGEDYNIGTLGINQNIIKTKAVNRTSSGISRYFDLRDASGKYSNTLLYSDDGILFTENLDSKYSFDFVTRNDIESSINNIIIPAIKDTKLLNFYYKNFPRNTSVKNLNFSWNFTTFDTNRSTGYFIDTINSTPIAVSSFTKSIMRYVTPGALIKFDAPNNYYFSSTGDLALGSATTSGSSTYKWVKVISVEDNGTVVNADTGLGPIVLNDKIPQNAVLAEIIPVLDTSITDAVKTQIIDQAFAFKTFGLRYDFENSQWRVIISNNLDTRTEFGLGKSGDSTNTQSDNSWLLLFETDGQKYTVTARGRRYVFESNDQIRFFFDSTNKIYNSKSGTIVSDVIKVLSINTKPDALNPFTVDWPWQITKEYKNDAGYINSKKIEISFFDTDNDGVVDDPDLFEHIVAPETNSNTKYIYQKKTTVNKTETFNYIDADKEPIYTKTSQGAVGALSQYNNGDVFYLIDRDVFLKYNQTANALEFTSDYLAYFGRTDIKFEYSHAADEQARIDPSSSNIIDVYLLTKSYDNEYRDYIKGNTQTKPLPPSSDNLYLDYNSSVQAIKSISDDVIYHPVKYKPILGSKSDVDLQATIKVVKNSDRVVNDNDVKSRVIDSVNAFFALENWDFGETFYFSELATYIINQSAPDIVSVVLVPKQETQSFGSLYEIKSENDEILISSASVDDVEIIDAITQSRLKASGLVVTSDDILNVGVQSSDVTSTGGVNY